MEYFFSDKIRNLKPSAIREIFKYAADPAVVSLSAGNPAPDAFPTYTAADYGDVRRLILGGSRQTREEHLNP